MNTRPSGYEGDSLAADPLCAAGLADRPEATECHERPGQDARLDGPEFQQGAYRLGVTGSPILEEATAYLEATLDRTLEAGDHTIMVGRVVALEVVRDAPPLIYYRSGYRSLT